ncbi:cytochrome P450 [Streptomyces sp. TR1341]|uniref:cytochrome P450 n=1 Tax=Streptomyces TaxID=1883 RepID=UPI000FFF0E84|nr:MULTISPECIES: cytochrome P450 [Streptomyces]NDK29642.1 cytochrome P450 [Streptomyces sp. TR1341]
MESTLSLANVSRQTIVPLFSRLRTSRGQANPLAAYQELRKLGEVFPAPWGGYLVTSHRLCHQVLRDRSWQVPDLHWRLSQDDSARWSSPASRQMAASLPMLNPPDHTMTRKSLGNIFDRHSLARLRPFVEETADRLTDRFFEEAREGSAEFCSLVADELPIITIGQWMGLPEADYELLRTLTHDQVHTQELFPSRSQLALSDSATAQLRQYFADVIRERRNSPGEDPISSWLRAWDGIEPDRARADAAVHSLALFMILAALETTSHVLSASVRLLVDRPHEWEWLRQHPEDVGGAVEETLRYDAPIHMISRVAAMDCEVGGVLVREGEMVQLMTGAAHHDPKQYADPHVFDIRRAQAHLSFGGGIHYCLGNALARLEATALLNSLLKRDARLSISAPPQWEPRIAFRRMTSLQLALG